MTETPATGPEPAATPPTEPLQLADQRPIAVTPQPAPVTAAKGSSHTVLAVVGAVVAVGLIALSGILGFALGHYTAGGRGHERSPAGLAAMQNRAEAGGPNAGGPGQLPWQRQDQGRGMMPGQGIDPDGDNWTGGQGQGPMPGQGMMPRQITPPGQGTPPGQITPPGQGTAPTTPQPGASPSGT